MGARWPLICLLLLAHGAPLPSVAQPGFTPALLHDRDRGELLLELEPLQLPASASHHAVEQPPPTTFTFPASGWLRGYQVELVDGRGRAVSREVIHHVNLILPQRRELFSPIMLRLGAAGAETGPVRLPRLLGYRVKRGDTLLVTAMLHNPTTDAYHGVRLRVRFEFATGRGIVPLVAIVPFYMDVMPPAGGHAFDLPPGRSEQSWEGRPAVAGRILGVGGHLHRYAIALRLEEVGTGRVIWEARPTVDERGTVVAMPTRTFLRRLGVPLRPDRLYRLTAIYDNPTGHLVRDGGMGALGGIFLPARGARSPMVNAGDPEYVLDVRTTRSGEHHGSEQHHHHPEHTTSDP